MSDHKRAGLHRAFSPSGLSGSNIHLAWCIPGLETLMWFVGKSRWQVHGSTLLTDSAGASGRVHNNTECLSPPPFPRLSNHTSYLNLCINMYIFSFSDITLATGQLQQELFVLQFLVFQSHCLCPVLSASHRSPLSYFITLTPTGHTHAHTLWLFSIILWLAFTPSITLLIPVSSPRLLSSTFSHWAYTQELEMWCLVLLLVCRMMSWTESKSISVC